VLTSHATVLLVPDVPAALDWWRDALGFEVEVYEGGDFYGYARRDGVYVHLSKCHDVRPNSVASPPDLFDLYLYVDDVEALHAELVERGRARSSTRRPTAPTACAKSGCATHMATCSGSASPSNRANCGRAAAGRSSPGGRRPRPNPETVEALLDTTWRISADERARTESLDRKASTLATFASIVLSLTASLGAGFLAAFDEPWAFALYVLGLLALIGSVFLAIRVLLAKELVSFGLEYVRRFPMWSELLKPPEQVRGETMGTLIEALAEARRANRVKSRRVRRAFQFLLVGLAFVVLQASILGAKELT
jgi:catechol 2,3-dioxygenase-like lactoylglutathione lyase family enzyme